MDKRKIETEVYSRCSGYFRPVKQWNIGKREEFSERRKIKFDLLISAPKKVFSEAEVLDTLYNRCE